MKGFGCRFSTGIAVLALLSGCSSLPSSVNPVEWWHDLQGGAIAEQRPPAPGADQPYPNLATVPDKPASPDMKLHQQIADALVADRANAQHAAAAAPLPDPSSPTASPALFGRGSAPPPAPAASSDTASASLDAATAPPAPPQAKTSAAPPSKAPVGPVGSAPLAPPPGSDVPGSTSAADATAPPALPTPPPRPPTLPGAPTSAVAAPAPPPPAPPKAAAVAAVPKEVGQPVPVGFEPGSAVLPAESAEALKALAGSRKNAAILVTGFGEAASSDPEAQSAALTLGLSRAQAMAAALAKDGVPAASVHVDAQAAGRGGVARLVD
jgi:outer membrane protein OmpA-like peptidoglycan-associated protein